MKFCKQIFTKLGFTNIKVPCAAVYPNKSYLTLNLRSILRFTLCVVYHIIWGIAEFRLEILHLDWIFYIFYC